MGVQPAVGQWDPMEPEICSLWMAAVGGTAPLGSVRAACVGCRTASSHRTWSWFYLQSQNPALTIVVLAPSLAPAFITVPLLTPAVSSSTNVPLL